MSNRQDNRVCARRGVAFVITLIFLALFACLAVAIAATADSNLTIARNRIEGQQASAFAATGIQLIQVRLSGMPAADGINADGAIDPGAMHNLIDIHLAPYFTGIISDANGVTLPTITLTSADGREGMVVVTILAKPKGTTVIVTAVAHYPHYKEIVDGGSNQDTAAYQNCGWCVAHDPLYHVNSQYPTAPVAQRIATYKMLVKVTPVDGHMPPYAVASKGKISLGGDAVMQGDVFSAYSRPPGDDTTPAVQLTKRARVEGDVIVLSDLPGIIGGGKKETEADVVRDHIISGAPIKPPDPRAKEPQWPVVDITPFKQYVSDNNVYTGTNGSGLTLSNVTIPPHPNGEEITFSGDTTIEGVMYIQAPNKVHFSGKATIIGVIVTDQGTSVAGQPTVNDLTNNYIKFSGQPSSSGVENLPADAKYDGLRDLKGSFLLAPGFSVQFAGKTDEAAVINGCMIASQFTFGGNNGGKAGVTFKGGVVNLGYDPFEITGSANPTLNRVGAVDKPAGVGFVSTMLVCEQGSYAE